MILRNLIRKFIIYFYRSIIEKRTALSLFPLRTLFL